MRISDWSSDVCSSDLTAAKGFVHMRVILVSLIFLVTACNAAKPSTSDPAETEHQTKTIQLTIQSGTKVPTFDVEVARTPEEQAKGLMFRKEFPATAGIPFPSHPPPVATYCMKKP